MSTRKAKPRGRSGRVSPRGGGPGRAYKPSKTGSGKTMTRFQTGKAHAAAGRNRPGVSSSSTWKIAKPVPRTNPTRDALRDVGSGLKTYKNFLNRNR